MKRVTPKGLKTLEPTDAVFILTPEDRLLLSNALLTRIADMSDFKKGEGRGDEANALRTLFTALQTTDADLKAARRSA